MPGRWFSRGLIAVALVLCASTALRAADPPHPIMQWVKRHPLPGTPKPSPRMGYETSYGYDPASRLLIRWGGHNQGGGGEQNAEIWTWDLDKDLWTLHLPNDAPPGVCCAQQNVFDDVAGRFVRFPAFSGSHGWQSFREIYLKNSSVWTYDLPTNMWRNMRPCPEPHVHGLHGAAWDPHHQVTVVHGGEGANHGTLVYDLYANTWVEQPKGGGAAAPSNQSQPGFTYDAVHGLYVRFGAQFDDDERTWVYDLPANTWRLLDVKDPPANREKEASPVLAADTRNGIVLCSIRRGTKHETWALDVAKPEWRRLDLPAEPDPSGSRNRVLVYLADRNLFVLENSTSGSDGGSREQQIWTFRYAEAPPPPPPRVNLKVTTDAAAATLAWETPAGGSAAAWNVYRGEGARPWEVARQRVAQAVKGGSFKDTGLKRGTTYFYHVCRAADRGEGPSSRVARTQPPVVTDVTVSVVGPKRVEIDWHKLAAEDVVGYHVERADVAVYSAAQCSRIAQRYKPVSERAVGAVRQIGPFRRLTEQPVTETHLVDTAIDLAAGQREPAEPVYDRPLHKDNVSAGGKPYPYAVYAYRVVAVNRLGVEGGPSPYRLTIPGAVEQVFSKEEGDEAARLKWQANREKGIAGYLVYRHDGRYDKEPITRLTAEPIVATEFTDAKAGKDTRRYEVVAVDALGQEGEPSRPVWSRREWGKYYVPYVGEWHQ